MALTHAQHTRSLLWPLHELKRSFKSISKSDKFLSRCSHLESRSRTFPECDHSLLKRERKTERAFSDHYYGFFGDSGMSCPACVGKLITKEERASVGFCKPTFGVCESERKQLGHSDSHTSLEHLGGNLGGPKPYK